MFKKILILILILLISTIIFKSMGIFKEGMSHTSCTDFNKCSECITGKVDRTTSPCYWNSKHKKCGSFLGNGYSETCPINTGTINTSLINTNIPYPNNDVISEQKRILENIKKIQDLELTLYKELDAAGAGAAAVSAIIDRINQLSQVRMSLYKSLNYRFISQQYTVASKKTDLVILLTNVTIIEEELNRSKARLNQLYETKHNRMRMVEINTYYGKQYKAQTRVMKLIIFVFLLLLVLVIVQNNGLLPDSISALLLFIVFIIGGFYIIYRILDIYWRDNMNFDAYDWQFNPNTQKPTTTYDPNKYFGIIGDTHIKDNALNFVGIDCIGNDCCSSGTTYDSISRKCIKSIAPETFVSGQLTSHCFNGKLQEKSSDISPIPYGNDDSINFASV